MLRIRIDRKHIPVPGTVTQKKNEILTNYYQYDRMPTERWRSARVRDRGECRMPGVRQIDPLLNVLRDTITGMVRRNGPDLSARQFAVFLICYLESGPHTVRGLASRLAVSRPVVTRLMDRMEELDLARRVPDPRDRRSVLIDRTSPGDELLTDIVSLVGDASRHPMHASDAVVRLRGRE